MVRFPEATSRLFANVFICKKCKTKIKAPYAKILQRRVKCRRCGGKAFRPIKKIAKK